jgi:hypothetical protein
MWQGASLHDVQSSIRPYFEGDMLYGDLRSGRSKLPYEAFAVRVAFGGGNPISQVGVRGRLLALPFGGGPAHQFSIFQTFDFIQNNAYEFGGQGVEVEFATTRRLSSRASLWMAGWGGVSLLAAVNSLVAPPEGAVVPSGGGTYADRLYDYGPGARWGAAAELSRAGTPRASLVYQAYQVFVVDGRRASHVLQRLHLDLRWPVKGPLALGAAGELFFRKAYFWAATDRTDSSPQFRLFLAWSRQP